MRKTVSRLVLVLATFLFAVGCDSSPPKSVAELPPIQDTNLHQGDWERVGEGIERRMDRNVAPSQSTLVLYRFAKDGFDFTFHSATSGGTVEAWRDGSFSDASAVMNAEYFDERAMPVGYFVMQGKRVGTTSFDLDKSGFFVGGMEPRLLRVSALSVFSKEKEVIQSYPFLIEDGVAAVREESGKVARRSFVGLDKVGNVYLGVVPFNEITLFQLSEYLATLGVSWEAVLNLDGGPSTGLSVVSEAWKENLNSITVVPNVFVVKRKGS